MVAFLPEIFAHITSYLLDDQYYQKKHAAIWSTIRVVRTTTTRTYEVLNYPSSTTSSYDVRSVIDGRWDWATVSTTFTDDDESVQRISYVDGIDQADDTVDPDELMELTAQQYVAQLITAQPTTAQPLTAQPADSDSDSDDDFDFPEDVEHIYYSDSDSDDDDEPAAKRSRHL